MDYDHSGWKERQKEKLDADYRSPQDALCSYRCHGKSPDLMDKVRKAKAIKGTRFIHALVPCPTGWRMAEDLSAKATMAGRRDEASFLSKWRIIDRDRVSDHSFSHKGFLSRNIRKFKADIVI